MRHLRRLGFAALLLATFASAGLAATELPPGVSETSFTTASGERVLELSADVPGSVTQVWDAWATRAGFQSWAVPFAVVDFRAGGVVESSYDPAAKPGARDNIRNEIMVVVPQRLFVQRNVQAPQRTPFDAATFQKTLTTVSLTPLGEDRTRVTVTNSGYQEGAPWDGVYQFFRAGNAWSLQQLQQRFEKGPVDWAKALAPPAGAKQ